MTTDQHLTLEDYHNLAQALIINKTVTCFGVKSLDDEGIIAVMEAFHYNDIVTELLVLCRINVLSANAIAQAIMVNKSILRLDLQKCFVGCAEVIPIIKAIQLNQTITQLNLGGNFLGRAAANALANLLMVNKSITILRLDNNLLGDEGAIVIAEALRRNSSVIELYLGCNSIGDTGMIAIAGTIEINIVLTRLDLRDNSIGDVGAAAFADSLLINRTIPAIFLLGNIVGDVGAKAFANTLMSNTTVECLNLLCNGVGDQGAIALAKALKINRCLTTLILADNLIGDEGHIAIAEALRFNATLTFLGLAHDGLSIEEKGAIAIAEALKINNTITTICGVDLNKYLTILSLPEEFCDKLNYQILDFLKERQKSGSQEMYRMKVMFVGPGAAGKSTLVHRILTGDFNPGQFQLTDGVSMKEWNSLLPNKNHRISLSLWDFGGQEVYLNSHPVLFSDRSFYLLIWNPLSDTTVDLLRQYVINIRSKSKTAPILLVTTHSQEIYLEEYIQFIQELSSQCTPKGGACHHFAVDSSTGDGIENFKSKLIQFVTEDYSDYARVAVPQWYGTLESLLRNSSSRGIFSLTRTALQSLTSSSWNDSPPQEEADQRMNIVLDLFHHWGVIYLLPSQTFDCAGDVVLNPQNLADVFKAVITCRDQGSIENGILPHKLLSFIWSKFDSRLHSQFLYLLHNCELAYELFDERNVSTQRSLVPSLLPEISSFALTPETQLREKMFLSWSPCTSDSCLLENHTSISRGYVKITFDCLLPNFFPKLLVRLRFLSSEYSRHHCVIRVPEGSTGTGRVNWSLCCIIEDRDTHSLIVYPGGHSYQAASIANRSIRYLLDESFSGMVRRDVIFSDGNLFHSNNMILELLRFSSPHRFLSPLFHELDLVEVPVISEMSTCLQKYLNSRDIEDKFSLSRSLEKAIPFLREKGLKIYPRPNILWFAGKSNSGVLHLFAVSPSPVPCTPWEIVPKTEIIIPDDSPRNTELSDLLLHVLQFLFPDEQLPRRYGRDGTPIQWIGLTSCRNYQHLLCNKEEDYFILEKNLFGKNMYYPKSIIASHRELMATDPLRMIIREEIATGVEKLQDSLGDMQLTINGSIQSAIYNKESG